jgi:hypothetical protein
MAQRMVSFEMTDERKAKWAMASMRIIDIVFEATDGPIEALALVKNIGDGLASQCGINFRDSFLVQDDEVGHS